MPPRRLAAAGGPPLGSRRTRSFNDGFLGHRLQLRTRHDAGKTNGVGVLEVSVDGRDHDARLNRDQIDADEGDAHPGVNDDALVEYPIKDVNKTRTARYPFNSHSGPPLRRAALLLPAPCSRR